jgi:pentatricopeptide repeat protein
LEIFYTERNRIVEVTLRDANQSTSATATTNTATFDASVYSSMLNVLMRRNRIEEAFDIYDLAIEASSATTNSNENIAIATEGGTNAFMLDFQSFRKFVFFLIDKNDRRRIMSVYRDLYKFCDAEMLTRVNDATSSNIVTAVVHYFERSNRFREADEVVDARAIAVLEQAQMREGLLDADLSFHRSDALKVDLYMDVSYFEKYIIRVVIRDALRKINHLFRLEGNLLQYAFLFIGKKPERQQQQVKGESSANKSSSSSSSSTQRKNMKNVTIDDAKFWQRYLIADLGLKEAIVLQYGRGFMLKMRL